MVTPAVSPAIQLDDLQQQTLWEKWVGANARSRYFAILARRYSKYDQSIAIVSAVLSGSAVAAIINDSHLQGFPWLKLVFPAVAGFLSATSFVRRFGNKIYDCSELYYKWEKLALECQDLWSKMYNTSAPVQLREIEEKGLELSKSALRMLPDIKRLMRICQQEAEKELKNRLEGTAPRGS
jgi:hypothetical protein